MASLALNATGGHAHSGKRAGGACWRTASLFGTVGALLLLVAGASQADEITIFKGRTMGPIPYQVRAVLPAGVDAQQLQDQIGATLSGINQQMSTYLADSELSGFNSSREVGVWIPVSEPTAKVVAEALRFAKLSGGAFDPTVGPLVNLWGFGPDKRRPETPPDAEIAQAKSRVGFAQVSVRMEPPALRKSAAEVELDLSAIAKGYAVDALGKLLRQQGCEAYMVEIGGEVIARGRKPGGDLWNIGIEKPSLDGTFTAILSLDNAALATSGDYRNYYVADGRRYSHTIDPATGRPVDHTLATVSVHAATCLEADALATILMVLGPERGLAFANEQGIAAVLVSHEGDGFTEHKSAAWERLGEGDALTSEPSPQAESNNLMSAEYLTLVLIAAIVFGLVILIMAVGVIAGGKRIRGSCGGIAGSTDSEGNPTCSLCHDPSPHCTRTTSGTHSTSEPREPSHAAPDERE